jgi:U3 small nucleolar RNA-associated protein 5
LEDEQANVQDLDEPALGQRLRGIRATNPSTRNDDEENEDDEDDDEDDDDEDEDDEEDAEDGDKRGLRRARAAPLPAGSLSLGETLTQALHSNDTAMLSSCLAHSDPTIIRLSVSRLNGPLALRLLEHCIDLMARGGRRSAGQLDSARARGIIEWVRATLTAHTSYLMSLPSLVSRLAQLHAALTSRLASQERLLALNGRLELVLSQIELRAAYTSEQARVQGVKRRGQQNGVTNRKDKVENRTEDREWVETSSDEEDASMDVDNSSDDDSNDDDEEVPIVRAEEMGGVQDIALGQLSRKGASKGVKPSTVETDDSEEDEEDEEDEGDGNELLDLEAMESDDADDDEEEEGGEEEEEEDGDEDEEGSEDYAEDSD